MTKESGEHLNEVRKTVYVPRCTATLAATLWGQGEWANAKDWDATGSLITGTINIWETPSFANPASRDYHLSPGSAAVNQGISTWVTTDMDSDPRLGAPDIGADEYIRARLYLLLVLRN